jgi:hypothetical protein
MPQATSLDPAAVADAVDLVRRIPDRYRTFDASAAELSRLFRIDAGLLECLLDHGLPCGRTGAERRFDMRDAQNVGLTLNLRTPRRIGMRWWSKALNRNDAHPAHMCEVRIAPTGRSDDAGGTYALDPMLIEGAEPGSVREISPGEFTFRVRLTRGRRPFGEPYRDLFNLLSFARFQLLPVELWFDLAFLADAQIANCELASHLLLTRAAETGLEARPSEGFFVAEPYATWHSWVEFRVDSEWVAADPFMLNSLARWGIIDPRTWPLHRSPQSVLWRLGPRGGVLVARREDPWFALLSRDDRPVWATASVLSQEPVDG